MTIGAAVAAANAYVTANPGAYAKINVGPGRFIETSLPLRLKPGILVQGSMQRGTILEPAAGQELNGFFALDSGCMIADMRFAGHQAIGTSDTDSDVGTRAWAIRFNEQANGGQGVYLTASPYVKDCASITAEDDLGLAGSISVGDTGGGVEVDGAKCKSDSPIRSMVIYGFTQQNLGGPGAIIKNDAYAELVSFFGLFGTWHVQTETGGQATLSGGGCSEFGLYGLVADGYSPTPIFTGTLRVAALAGALSVDVVNMTANRLGTSSRPAAGSQMLLGGNRYVVQNSVPIDASGTSVADSAPTRAGYRVNFFNETAIGLVANVAQGATADFRQRSTISAGAHTALYVGSGTNYGALPNNGGVPVRENQIVQRNGGRVFCTLTNEVGDFEAGGGVFKVDGTTGASTLDGSKVNLSNINAIGPFSRNGGQSTVGIQIKEASNNTTLLNSLGLVGQDTAPTQFAVKTYIDALLPGDIGAAPAVHGHAIDNISGLQAALDGKATAAQGDLAESAVQPAGLTTALAGKADLVGGLVPAAQLPGFVDDVLEYANFAAFPQPGEIGKQYLDIDQRKIYRWSGTVYQEISPSPGSTDAVPEGLVNLYFTLARSRNAISGAGLITYDPLTGTIGFSGTLFNPAAPGAIGGTTADAATFTRLGSKRQVVTATGSPLTITLDASAVNEFVAAASVTANTIISITGLGTIPPDEVIRYVFAFTWASGAITLSASGYTFKRAGSVPASAGEYRLVIEARGDSTVLSVSYGSPYT